MSIRESSRSLDDSHGLPAVTAHTFYGIIAISMLQSVPMARAAESVSAPAAQPAEVFSVLEYRVEGNTLLRASDIDRAVAPYVGKGRSIQDVEAARQSLQKLYHDHGYQTVLVDIPEQEVGSGTIRLVVLEVSVGQVQIKGSRYHSEQSISAALPQLRSGVVLNFDELRKELAQLNNTPDLRVSPVLQPSATSDRVDVDINVQDQLPLHATLEVNNRYSANTDHIRLIGEVDYDNLFQRNQMLGIQYEVAPEDPAQVELWSLSYVIPLQGGLVWALHALHSNSSIAAVGNTDVIGNGSVYGMRLIDTLSSSHTDFLQDVTAGIDYKDWKQGVNQEGAEKVSLPVHYLLYSLQYTATWLGTLDTERHASAATSGMRSNTTLDVGLNFAVRPISGADANQFVLNRYGASPSFYILHPDLQRQQILPHNWTLVGALGGQYASGPLIVNEQYAAGGVDSARGYREAESLGDEGARASLELRTPQLLASNPRFTNSYFYVFADDARVKIRDPQSGERTSYHLKSEGIGFRLKFAGLAVEMDGARADTPGFVTRAGDYSAQFKVSYQW